MRTITALAIAALAEAAHPYGIESFDSVLKPLWKGIKTHRGKGLAAFLKAIGYVIPLMDAEYANYYTREVMLVLIREFASPDEEMKKIVLKGELAWLLLYCVDLYNATLVKNREKTRKTALTLVLQLENIFLSFSRKFVDFEKIKVNWSKVPVPYNT